MARYLLLGHITKDLRPQGGFQFGGAVLYAGLTVRRLSFETRVFTACAEEKEELESLFPELSIFRQASSETTTFENRETSSGRIQRVYAQAPRLDFDLLPSSWRQTDVLHLAPVLGEVPLEKEAYESFSYRWLVASPQGWFRKLGPEGRVLPRAPDLSKAPSFKALVVSEEDLRADPEGLKEVLLAKSEILVLTQGARGALLWTEGQVLEVPAPSVSKVVDTTGAGDILAGSFLAFLYGGDPPLKALEKALKLASISVTRSGLASVPNFKEMANLR